jgi:Xaa-Pro aminopeptidase
MARFLLTASLLLCAVVAHAGELQDDLKARRARLMEKLGPKSMLILHSASVKNYSLDVDHEYRQDSNFYYLTGVEQEESVLVLMPGNRNRREVLFIRQKDPKREHREGRSLSQAEAVERSGIETVYWLEEFERFVEMILSGEPYRPEKAPRLDRSPDFDTFLHALAAGEAELAVVLDQTPTMKGPVNPARAFANDLRDRFLGFRVVDVTRHIHGLRQVKSPYERKVLEQSAAISVDAQRAGMRAVRSGAYEYEVKAAIEQVYRGRGALGWSYPPITGSGPNATTLHYAKADRRMDAGELMLVDAAANFQYYTVDITRTYPVSGRFTEAQKDIYAIVLRAQEEAAKFARPGVLLRDVHHKTVDVIKDGLQRLGLLTDTSGDQYTLWYTHGSTHYIGIDVHDVGDYQEPLAPGQAFVIEPGVYIREDAFESLDKTPENEEFIRKVKPAFEKYKNIGIRIEDSFLLTEDGLVNLSAEAPKTLEQIEGFLKGR